MSQSGRQAGKQIVLGGWLLAVTCGVASALGQAPASSVPLKPAPPKPALTPALKPALKPPAAPAVQTGPANVAAPARAVVGAGVPGRFVVVLDAAHGGDDGGAQVGNAVAEKTVTLALSVRLRSLLTARGVSVVTTREGNVNLDDVARLQVVNHAGGGAVSSSGAAACVSFHATQAGSGVHVYVSSLGPTVPTRFLAWKTAQSAFVTRSLKLASVVNSSLEHSAVARADSSDSTAAPGRAVPVVLARTSLPGLDSMTCPAVALEVAPIRSADRKVLTEVTDTQYQTQIVEALAAAMMEWRTDVTGDASSGAGGQKP